MAKIAYLMVRKQQEIVGAVIGVFWDVLCSNGPKLLRCFKSFSERFFY